MMLHVSSSLGTASEIATDTLKEREKRDYRFLPARLRRSLYRQSLHYTHTCRCLKSLCTSVSLPECVCALLKCVSLLPTYSAALPLISAPPSLPLNAPPLLPLLAASPLPSFSLHPYLFISSSLISSLQLFLLLRSFLISHHSTFSHCFNPFSFMPQLSTFSSRQILSQ